MRSEEGTRCEADQPIATSQLGDGLAISAAASEAASEAGDSDRGSAIGVPSN